MDIAIPLIVLRTFISLLLDNGVGRWPVLFAMLAGGVVPAVGFDGVAGFVEAYCVQCHGSNKEKGGVTLHDLGSNFEDEETADRWLEVLIQLTTGDMPPRDAKALPSGPLRRSVIQWIETNLEPSDRAEAYRKKLLAPEYGNWVDHETLFSGDVQELAFSPSRIWRLSPEMFNKKGFGRARSPFAYVTSQKGIRDYSSMAQVDQSTVQMILVNVDQFLEERQRKGEFSSFAEREGAPSEEVLRTTVAREFRRIVGRKPSEDEEERYRAFLKKNVELGGNLEGLKTTIKGIFLSPEAIYRMEFGLGQVDQHGRRQLSPDEIVNALAYALTDDVPERSPILWNAYQSDELKGPDEVSKVVRTLLDEELGKGTWSAPALPRVMRFFEQFFGFDRAGDVFKDNDRRRLEGIPQWNTQYLVHDAKMIIEHVLRGDQDVIAELLTTNDYFVAHPGNNDYAREFYDNRVKEVTDPEYVNGEVAKAKLEYENRTKPDHVPDAEWEERRRTFLKERRNRAEQAVRLFTNALAEGIHPHPDFPFSNRSRGLSDLIYITAYNLPESGRSEDQRWNWPVEQPFPMPRDQRSGILTHPAWLAAWSLNDGNDPIHRGIWVLEKLLAGKLQDLPPDVDAQVPTDPHQTLRERMEILREERCWNCHHKINPLGETFEIFDDWGRYRTHVYFGEDGKLVKRRDQQFEKWLSEGKLTAREVNAAGEIQGTGESDVDGEVKDAVEMLHRIGRSTRARQSFIRHLFRYFMGRNEMLSDSRTLVAAERAYLANNGSFKALVVSLLSSDSFLYRR